MVDSIRKISDSKPGLGISETRSTKEDKRRQSPDSEENPQEANPENPDVFEIQDSTSVLSPGLPRASGFVSPREVKTLVLRRAKAQREQAILEVDVSLSDGTLIRGARVALNLQKVVSRLNRQFAQDASAGDSLIYGTTHIFAKNLEMVPTGEDDEPTEWTVVDLQQPKTGWLLKIGITLLSILGLSLLVYYLL